MRIQYLNRLITINNLKKGNLNRILLPVKFATRFEKIVTLFVSGTPVYPTIVVFVLYAHNPTLLVVIASFNIRMSSAHKNIFKNLNFA